ncbi:MAG: GH25 family lysozyme [Oscillospiraceae bacterium]
MKILDISKYQSNVDYAKCAKDIDGVILRCGITYWGQQVTDISPYFERHYAGFKAVGEPIGVYYYSTADTVDMAKREVQKCLEILKGKTFELPIYVDIENNQRQGNLSKKLLTEITDTFCNILQNAGYYVGVYASTSWFASKLDHASLAAKYTIWLADYRANYDKNLKRDMHQYTSGGTVQGINGRVDLSNAFVDFAKIIKSKGLNGFAPTGEIIPVPSTPQRLKIGYASKGDILSITSKLDELHINCEVSVDGYIVTSEMSGGDSRAITSLCTSLQVPCAVYVAPVMPPEGELQMLKAKVAQLTADNQTLKKEIAEMTAINSQLTSLLTQANADKKRFSEQILIGDKIKNDTIIELEQIIKNLRG